jgi:hypothetical protein
LNRGFGGAAARRLLHGLLCGLLLRTHEPHRRGRRQYQHDDDGRTPTTTAPESFALDLAATIRRFFYDLLGIHSGLCSRPLALFII